MDGVICDFDKEYHKLFGCKPDGTKRDQKEFYSNWPTFIRGNHFEKLDWFPGAKELLKFISNLQKEDPSIVVEMLTSTGGERYHDIVEQQKIVWLCDHGISYKANCVAGRKHKGEYGGKWKVLIDDTKDCIEHFEKAEGRGILHTDVNETILKVNSYYNEYLLSSPRS